MVIVVIIPFAASKMQKCISSLVSLISDSFSLLSPECRRSEDNTWVFEALVYSIKLISIFQQRLQFSYLLVNTIILKLMDTKNFLFIV